MHLLISAYYQHHKLNPLLDIAVFNCFFFKLFEFHYIAQCFRR